MTLKLNLTPEQEALLRAEAERNGLPLEDYALRRLIPASTAPRGTGAQVLARLQAAGIIGTFADRPDSPAWARALRLNAERRAG